MGESVTEGSIVEWRVKPGQWVDEGATVVDVTTDKVDVEVPAPASGVVTALLANEGDTVAVGAVLAEIDPSAERAAASEATGARPAAVPSAPEPSATRKPGAPSAATVERSGNGAAAPTATPQARRAARWAHVALERIHGSGPAGL